jgi:hypothetical protein
VIDVPTLAEALKILKKNTFVLLMIGIHCDNSRMVDLNRNWNKSLKENLTGGLPGHADHHVTKADTFPMQQ